MRDLKERLESLADQGEPLGAVEIMRRARYSLDEGQHGRIGRRVRHVLIPTVAAVAVAAVVAGAVVIVNRSEDKGPSILAGGGEPPSDATLFLVPGFVPDGFDLIQASGGDQPDASAGGGGTGSDWRQHYVRFDAAHEHPVEILDIQWGATAPGGLDDPANVPPEATRVTVRGHDGLYSSEFGSLAWEEPEGQLVNVQGTLARETVEVQGSTSLPLEFLQAVADALEARDGGGFELPDPPGGFELVAEGPGEYSNGTNPRTLAYRGPDGRGLWLNLVDDSELPPGFGLYYSTDRLVDVRGQQGVLTPTRGALVPGSFDRETLFIGAGADLSLQWVEPGNVQVTMSGVGLSESELLAIAESLEPVDTKTWFGLQTAPPDPPPATAPLPRNEDAPPLSTIGPPPQDEDAAREEITRVFAEFGAIATIDDALAKLHLIDDPTGLEETISQVARNYPDEVANDSYRVTDVRFLSATEAVVTYDILIRDRVSFGGRVGRAVLVDGTWRITRGTVCSDYSLAGVQCLG